MTFSEKNGIHPSSRKPRAAPTIKEDQLVSDFKRAFAILENYLTASDMSRPKDMAQAMLICIKAAFKPQATARDVKDARDALQVLEMRNINVPLSGHTHETIAHDVPKDHKPCDEYFHAVLIALYRCVDRKQDQLRDAPPPYHVRG